MDNLIILHLQEHTVSINDKPVFNHIFEVFENLGDLKAFKKSYIPPHKSEYNKQKVYKDVFKLGNFTVGISICNETEWRWIRGLTNIKDSFGNYVYIDQGY